MSTDRSSTWRYSICGLLLLATMLMYMDRLTISLLATTIQKEYAPFLNNEKYGLLESGFSLAFAAGAIIFGFIVDRLGPRWIYPGVVAGWSFAGLATAHAEAIGTFLSPLYAERIGTWFFPESEAPPNAYIGFMVCRIALGFFEAGHWPCALVTTQAILARGDRSLGNSILQSGAAFGSVVTPPLVLALVTDGPGGWQPAFVVIGCLGFFWGLPWLSMIRRRDLERTPESSIVMDAGPVYSLTDRFRMFGVLIVIVVTINLTWQYFRVWLPKYLEEMHGYSKPDVAWFIPAYYIAADVGCIGVGIIGKWLISSGWEVHRARLWTFTVCAGLTLIAVPIALFSKTSPALLMILFLVAAGSLGLFPNYYSFTQEISRKHQGMIGGTLGTIAWIGSAIAPALIGKNIDETKSYDTGIIIAGIAPLFACAALWLFWPRRVAAAATPTETLDHSAAIQEKSDQIRKL